MVFSSNVLVDSAYYKVPTQHLMLWCNMQCSVSRIHNLFRRDLIKENVYKQMKIIK